MVAIACGLLALGVVAFLISPLLDQNRRLVGEKNEVEDLQKRKDFLYAAMRELNIDYNMGKLSAEDHRQLEDEYMREASTILDQLQRHINGKQHVDAQIEQTVLGIRKKRVVSRPPTVPASPVVEEPELVAIASEDTPEMTVSEAAARAEGSICSQCNTKNDGDANFCIECGASLKKTACVSCSAENKAGAKFCAHCGEKL